MPLINAVFLDADDTVFTVHPSVPHHYLAALAHHNFKVSEATLAQSLKKNWLEHIFLYENESDGYRCTVEQDKAIWQQFATAVVKEVTGSDSPSADLIDSIYETFAKGSSRKIIEGLPDAITQLRSRGIFVGLFTNNDVRVHSVLEDLGLTPLFDVILTAGEVGYKKPAKQAFDALLTHSKTKVQESLFIGDSLKHDYYGALQAGWNALLFSKNTPPTVPIETQEVIHSLERFSDLIDKIQR